jgi:hypothetical protein
MWRMASKRASPQPGRAQKRHVAPCVTALLWQMDERLFMYHLVREGRSTLITLGSLLLCVRQALVKQIAHVRIVQAVEDVPAFAAEVHQPLGAHVAELV